MFVITAGMGLFGILTGYLAQNFVASRKRKREKQAKLSAPPDKTEAILKEIEQLRIAQEEARDELSERMAALERWLEKEDRER